MNTRSIPRPQHPAVWRRNLRTAAVLGLAASGGFVSTTWLAATAGGTFLTMTAWRTWQMRQASPQGNDAFPTHRR